METEAGKRDAVIFRAEDATGGSPFKILLFTMLSARTRDEATMKATERLFKRAKTPKQIRSLDVRSLERLLSGVGFFRTKARHLMKTCRLLEDKDGTIPNSLEGLLALPGVGRKTANIVLARAFHKNTVGVDVHVHRISNRLGIARTKKPEETERALVSVIPEALLPKLNRSFVAYGQTVCLPRRPRCSACAIRHLCARAGVSSFA
ncbi:MAG: endonuclease III [Candidatus Micrarchaeota archaeon]